MTTKKCPSQVNPLRSKNSMTYRLGVRLGYAWYPAPDSNQRATHSSSMHASLMKSKTALPPGATTRAISAMLAPGKQERVREHFMCLHKIDRAIRCRGQGLPVSWMSDHRIPAGEVRPPVLCGLVDLISLGLADRYRPMQIASGPRANFANPADPGMQRSSSPPGGQWSPE